MHAKAGKWVFRAPECSLKRGVRELYLLKLNSVYILQACCTEFNRQRVAVQTSGAKHEVNVSAGNVALVHGSHGMAVMLCYVIFLDFQSNWGWNSTNKRTEVEETAAW